ncbi:MAG: N-acetylglucosamine kinase [Vicinamibacteraceae bacterium]
MHVLGIDAGGTKTVCLLADAQGRVMSRAQGAGANLQSQGELEVEKTLHEVMEEAIGASAIVPRAICLGIAGVDRDEDAEVVHAVMRRIGYRARVVVTNDALIALTAGVGDGPGVAVIAGTGSIAYGRNARNEAARAGGWGYVLGDEGSGYWLGRHALRAVVRAADGRGGSTALTRHVLAHFGIERPQDLVREVYTRALRPSAIAKLAAAVQRAHEEGDGMATSILDRAARELVASTASVVKQLDMAHEAFPVVLAGGIFQVVPVLVSSLTLLLPQVAPHGTVRRLPEEPAYGAVLIALAEARGAASLPRYKAV